ncbi:response regulator transcription factor [Devosia naphthalenivorans]|uniref:response regulator transcription factor n=1 Tax=Devosia naphthalenivorans TaxID=2082392 RepID=UPI000D36B139|nr:response regulator transcription factor [Devosia naphthalenivorans]
MTQLTILLVEPGAPEAALLTVSLEGIGFKVAQASTPQNMVNSLASSEPVHLVLANWNQYGYSGLELADIIHGRAKVLLPVVMYARSVADEDLDQAKSAGVSALISLPISESELNQRLTPLLRERYPWAYPARSVVGDIELDRETHVVTRRGHRIHLTPSDFRMLELLVRKPGEVLSREVLLEAFSSPKAGIRTVDVRVQRLKSALTVGGNAPSIKAVRGKGYVIEA